MFQLAKSLLGTNAASAQPGSWSAQAPRRVLVGCLLAVVLCSLPVFLRTFLSDDTTYALIAQKMNAGHVLYAEAADNKPPLIYATFAAMFSLFGAGHMVAVKLLTIAVDFASILLMFSIGTHLLGQQAGVLAAFLFTGSILSGVYQDSIATNTETYANLFTLAGLWVLARERLRLSPGALFAAGLLLAVASLYRTHAVCILGGIALYLAISLRFSPRALLGLLLLGVGFVIPYLLTVAYFSAHGALGDLWLWTVADNLFYVKLGSARVAIGKRLARIFGTVLSQLPMIVAALLALRAGRDSAAEEKNRLRFLLVLLAGALVGYQIGGRFYGHYFLQVAPFVCLLGAWGLTRVPADRLRILRRALPALVVLWCLGFAVTNSVLLARRNDDQDAVDRAVEYVHRNTTPQDEILLWAGSPMLPFRSGRVFATRFLNNNPMTGRIYGTAHVHASATPEMNRPLERPEAWRLFWKDLDSAPPKLVVDGTVPNFEIAHYPRLAALVSEHYASPLRFGSMSLYLRKN
jgi:hypothetical protein